MKYLHMSDGEWNTYVHLGKTLKRGAKGADTTIAKDAANEGPLYEVYTLVGLLWTIVFILAWMMLK